MMLKPERYTLLSIANIHQTKTGPRVRLKELDRLERQALTAIIIAIVKNKSATKRRCALTVGSTTVPNAK
jgi:hypothetical protein